MTAVIGWALLVMAAIPVLSPSIKTGVVSTLGLFAVALSGLTLIADRADGIREWLIIGGISLVVAGEWWYWRSIIGPHTAHNRRATDVGSD